MQKQETSNYSLLIITMIISVSAIRAQDNPVVIDPVRAAEMFDIKKGKGLELLNQILDQIMPASKKTKPTLQEAYRILSYLTFGDFVDIMQEQTKIFKALEKSIKALEELDDKTFASKMKLKFELTLYEREDMSAIFLEVFESEKGKALLHSLLQPLSYDQLQKMLDLIDEQKSMFAVVDVQLRPNTRSLYDAWQYEIKQAQQELKKS
jgi:hypothetical protein